MQVDESTTSASSAVLLEYCRFLDVKRLYEELLFVSYLKKDTKTRLTICLIIDFLTVKIYHSAI